MIFHTYSTIPYGYEGRLVEVEADLTKGLPSFTIVGMANKTVSEARERVRSAIMNSGLNCPPERVTINLAPAELQKDGTFLDLPIALSVLALDGQLLQSDLDNRIFVGELSLDGSLRPVRGIINIVEAARAAGFSEIILPEANLTQASLVPDVNLIGLKNLTDVLRYLKSQLLPPPLPVVKNTETPLDGPSLSDIRDQAFAKRALLVAVAGRHNLLLSGPPGTGKTLLARAAASLLPELSPAERISITKLHSLAGLSDTIVTSRPFRNPHHTSSPVAIIGGGTPITPGEISLAHLGVLFLDELPEYPRFVLEALRQPLEDREISISRAHEKTIFPADFMLIATMNPCPCGYLGDKNHECTCTPNQISAYKKKLSGPLLDRIDLRLTISRPNISKLISPQSPTQKAPKTAVKNTLTEATRRQHARFNDETTFNSRLSPHQISTLLNLSPSAKALLDDAATRLNLSARAYFRIIRVATTISDLEASDAITEAHIAEALTYR